jgi:hypothetical protein
MVSKRMIGEYKEPFHRRSCGAPQAAISLCGCENCEESQRCRHLWGLDGVLGKATPLCTVGCVCQWDCVNQRSHVGFHVSKSLVSVWNFQTRRRCRRFRGDLYGFAF